MNTAYLQNLKVVKAGPNLKERFEGWLRAEQAAPVVDRLQRFREDLEADMAPAAWTDLEGPAYMFLADVCGALGLSEAEQAQVLGVQGQAALVERVGVTLLT